VCRFLDCGSIYRAIIKRKLLRIPDSDTYSSFTRLYNAGSGVVQQEYFVGDNCNSTFGYLQLSLDIVDYTRVFSLILKYLWLWSCSMDTARYLQITMLRQISSNISQLYRWSADRSDRLGALITIHPVSFMRYVLLTYWISLTLVHVSKSSA